jgi:ATP/maltotriose-dependent transcriptional regulator MalT
MTVEDAGAVAVQTGKAALADEDWVAAYERLGAARQSGELDAAGLEALSEAAFGIGRMDEAFEAREQAYAGFDGADDPIAAGACAVWLAFAYFATGRPAIGGGWVRRAERCLEGHEDCAPFGQLLILGAHGAMGAGQLDQAAGIARQAVELGRRLHDANVEAMALQTLAGVLIAQGDVAEALASYDESMLFAVEGRLDVFTHGAVYCGMISACEDLGDVRRAAEWTDALSRWVKRHPFAIFPGICRVHRATVLQRQGSWPEAEAEARQASVDLAAMRMPGTVAAALAEIGDIRRRLGDVEGAETAFRTAEELGGQPQAGLAMLRLSQGRPDAAAAIIDRALADASGNPLARAKLLPAAVQISLARGAAADAQAAVGELEATAGAFGGPALSAAAATSRGRLSLAEGDAGAACATLQRALRLWQDLDVPYEAATVRLLLGQACRGTGDEDGAKASFAAAAQGFERLGAVIEARRIQESLRPAPTLPAGLTEREAQVLRLVAAGRSNKDVAAELFLSEKTVARHLSNIFVKIGVSSRSAATAFAFEAGIAGRTE